MKKEVVAIIVIVLLLLAIFFVTYLFISKEAPAVTQTPVLETPQTTTAPNRPTTEAQPVVIENSYETMFVPDAPVSYPSDEPNTLVFTPAGITGVRTPITSPGTQNTQPQLPSSPPTGSTITGTTTTPRTTQGTASSGGGGTSVFPRGDGVTYPRPAVVWPDTGDGVVRGGGNPGGGGRPDYEFNPQTGQARIGDYYFTFGPNDPLTTSNNIGDPDNAIFGTATGIFIGSLFGRPDIGLQLGAAIGSNLFPGYRLSDFGISIEEGIPSFNGINPNSGIGGLLGGGGGGSGGGGGAGSMGGMGGGYFGGFVIAIPCTCSEGNFLWTVSTPTQYAGTYLLTPSSRVYSNNQRGPGAFWVVGSYEQGSGQCMMVSGPDCIEITVSGGEINMGPGVGTS